MTLRRINDNFYVEHSGLHYLRRLSDGWSVYRIEGLIWDDGHPQGRIKGHSSVKVAGPFLDYIRAKSWLDMRVRRLAAAARGNLHAER